MEALRAPKSNPRRRGQGLNFFRRKKVIFSFGWALYLSLFLGLISGVGIGIADNGDGVRVTSPAGLNPQTETGVARGQGYVVTDFVSAANRSPISVLNRLTSLHYPTANAYLLTVMGVFSPDRSVSLFALGWVYLLVGLTIIWLAPIGKNPLPTVILMGVLALGPFARWMTSTYADTPAFFGFAALLISIVALLSHLNSKEFFRINVLFWWGLLLIALSKAAYAVVIPLIVIFFFVALILSRRVSRKGLQLAPTIAVAASGLALVGGMLAVQFGSSDRQQSNAINNHHFLMTVVIPNYPSEIVERTVPESIRELAPEGYWPRTDDWSNVPGWEETVTDNALILGLRLRLFTQPALLYELLSKSVSASTTPELEYLVANTWNPDNPPSTAPILTGMHAATTGIVHLLLYPLSNSVLAIPLLAVATIATVSIHVLGRRSLKTGDQGENFGLLALMILSGVLAGALAGAAIMGDGLSDPDAIGFSELMKHLIMTSFLFTVFAVSTLVLLGKKVLGLLSPIISSRKPART